MELRKYQSTLIRDVWNALNRGKRRPCVVLPCGGGKTCVFAYMAGNAQENGKTVWFLVHRRELLDQTVETFRQFEIPLQTIHIGMVGTVANHLDRWPAPDFIVFDECHFSMAATWQRIIQAFPDAFIAGLTATPCRLDGKPLGATYDALVEGISTRELIDLGYLAPYRYYAPAVADLSGLTKRGADFDPEKATDILSTRAVFGDVIQHYRTYADGMQAICYCATIRHSERMAKEFQEVGINAVHFDGGTPKAERTEIVRRYRAGEIWILCNVDLISHGFDCPDCECCILLRPTMSTALNLQQSMRCMRPAPGKTAVILDHVNNYTRHGLPDEEREWSLEGRLKARREYDADGRLSVRQCRECFGTYESKLGKCPYCGAAPVLTKQEIKNIKNIRLEEVKEQRRTQAAQAVAEISGPNECRNISELFALAKKKGYKPAWAYVQAKRRGWLR